MLVCSSPFSGPVTDRRTRDHTAEDDDRDEVGHIQHQLDLLFDFFALDAVEQESQNDGNGEAPQQAVDAQLEGVDKVALEIRRGHEALEVLETDPLAAQDVLEGVIILESDQDAAHRMYLKIRVSTTAGRMKIRYSCQCRAR